MTKNRGFFLIILLAFTFFVGCDDGLLDTGLGDASDQALVDAINDYRTDKGLAAIPKSPALMKTAKAHVKDLSDNNPVHGDCNLHSWSDNGDWSECCYTDDHANADCMWSKPNEIAGYPGDGYEIAAGGGGAIDAESALEQWKGSSGHNAVILNKDIWADNDWLALGAAIDGEFAVAWFGEVADPPEE